mmetsp:Transcript_36267/g.79342  ORF Transcript_36267/g.79342 Transcript_36267/m.79342 type:complete len:232 (-) Transcript_36267:61-756(-)
MNFSTVALLLAFGASNQAFAHSVRRADNEPNAARKLSKGAPKLSKGSRSGSGECYFGALTEFVDPTTLSTNFVSSTPSGPGTASWGINPTCKDEAWSSYNPTDVLLCEANSPEFIAGAKALCGTTNVPLDALMVPGTEPGLGFLWSCQETFWFKNGDYITIGYTNPFVVFDEGGSWTAYVVGGTGCYSGLVGKELSAFSTEFATRSYYTYDFSSLGKGGKGRRGSKGGSRR